MDEPYDIDLDVRIKQAEEDAKLFGAAWLTIAPNDPMKLVCVHPAEAGQGHFSGAWRMELYRAADDKERIFARIVDESTLIATIAGAVFLNGEPCCGNLDNARRIIAAQLQTVNEIPV